MNPISYTMLSFLIQRLVVETVERLTTKNAIQCPNPAERDTFLPAPAKCRATRLLQWCATIDLASRSAVGRQ